jgi:sulfoxide reductase catalytic subunit YedY
MVCKEPPATEITPKAPYLRRREFMRNAALFTATSAGVGGSALADARRSRGEEDGRHRCSPDLAVARRRLRPRRVANAVPRRHHLQQLLRVRPREERPGGVLGSLRTRPWTVTVDGEVRRPQVIDIDQLGWFPLEERVYRMRCVEAWSMVILGRLPAGDLRSGSSPRRAGDVAFTTLLDPQQMPSSVARSCHGRTSRAPHRRGDASAGTRHGPLR